MPAQDKLTPTEQVLAYVTGLGVVICMIALLLMGLGTIDNDNITKSLLLVGLAIVIIGIGGWLITVRPWEKFDDLKTPLYTGHHEAAAAAAPAAPAPAEPAPAAPSAPAGPDDLTLIEGIGPKSAEALNAAGITTFAQVAELSPEDLERTIKDRGVRLVGNAQNWPQQARMAAGGDLTALEALQERIKGGITQDDLTLIEGIGPKSAAALNAAGITTFIQVAAMSPDQLESILKERKVRLVARPETWPQQARLAAEGDLTALEALQQRIKSGVLRDDA